MVFTYPWKLLVRVAFTDMTIEFMRLKRSTVRINEAFIRTLLLQHRPQRDKRLYPISITSGLNPITFLMVKPRKFSIRCTLGTLISFLIAKSIN